MIERTDLRWLLVLVGVLAAALGIGRRPYRRSIQRGLRVFAALPFGVVLLIAMAVTNPFDAAIAAQSTVVPTGDIALPDGDLALSEVSDEALVGTFEVDGNRVTFSARTVDPPNVPQNILEIVTTESEHSPAGLFVIVSIDVDGTVIDFARDLETRIVYIDGRDQRLTRDGKVALLSLSDALQAELTDQGRATGEQGDLLIRTVSYWADAPVSYAMPTKAVPVHPPQPRNQEEAALPSASCDDLDEMVASLDGRELLACQVSDQNGIIYLPCDSAPPAYQWTNYHDASGHCWQGLRENTGPCASGCLGRCLSGCGTGAEGAYTLDCADHDSCCRHHGGGSSCWNPWDGNCGDEFGDADDDVLHGTVNCTGSQSCG